MRRLLRVVAVGGVVAAVVAVLLFTAWFRAELRRPFAAWDGEFVDVRLENGMSARSMLERLGGEGVLRNPHALRLWLAWRGGSGSLHAGEYRFHEPATPLQVLDRLTAGDVLLHPVTVPEGMVLEQVARRCADAGLGGYDDLLAAFRDAALVADLDPGATDLQGYLFPETYHFPRGESPAGVARAMVNRFRDVAGSDYGKRAAERGLDLREAVTLASMIEMETSLDEERPKIARVFLNRLERGMRLQCDPTVIHALYRAGRNVERLTYADLEFDSPWNTYVAFGLPPGPIANPGRASLEAAVNPADGRELYFVASPDGGHDFSTTLDAHLKAVARWKAYLRSSR